MSKSSQKGSLSEEQKVVLKQAHVAQITAEVALTVFILTIYTLNLLSVIPWYGVFDILVMLATGLTLFISGIILTATVSTMRRAGKPLENRSKNARKWLLTVWLCIPAIVASLIFNSPFKDEKLNGAGIALIGLLVLLMLVSMIASFVSVHFVWRRFNKKKRPQIRLITYGVVVANMLLLAIFGTYTEQEVINYSSVSMTDANLELGQKEVRQVGKDGEKQTRYNLIFGFPLSSTESEPVDEIVANGSRRYQYMYCSDGSYRYYNAEQFKDSRVGFTHQSPDSCAENGNGKQTTIADVPPPEKVVQRVPTYYPSYRPNSYTTTCNTYSFSNSITCRTY